MLPSFSPNNFIIQSHQLLVNINHHTKGLHYEIFSNLR